MQLPGCELKWEIKTLALSRWDCRESITTVHCTIFLVNNTQKKSIKRLTYQNRIHPGERKRDQKRGLGFVFFADVTINVGTGGFNFQREKRRWREKTVKVKRTKAGYWHSAGCFFSSSSYFLRALQGSFIKSTDTGYCSVGGSFILCTLYIYTCVSVCIFSII